MAQFLEMEAVVQQQIDACVDLIRQFPLIGTQLGTPGIEHRRRFICAGYRIIYDLKETGFVDLNQETGKSRKAEAARRVDITITRLKRV